MHPIKKEPALRQATSLAEDFKILILEDDAEIRQVIKFYVESRFSNILEADDIKSAFEILKSEPLDAVISDIHLPGGDGVEFLHLVKSLTPPLPKIIFVTGDGRFTREDAIENGATDFFYKPFNGMELVDALAKIIGKILIVSDKEDYSKSTQSTLEKEGYYVETTHIQDKELEKDFHLFDVIYFDLESYDDNSPWHDLVTKARKHHNMFELPILLTCNKENMEVMAKKTNLAINDLLPKYFDLDYNLAKLRNIILSKRRDDELNNSRNKAIEAMRLKSTFLANMSHEIRTPLNGIIGVVNMLEQTKLDSEQTELVSIIQKSGLKLQRILNDILDFSKIESKSVALECETFDLYELVHHVTALFAGNAKAKKTYLRSEISPNVPRYVKSDSLRIQQILSNLTNNSMKFTPTGGVTIELIMRPSKIEDKEEIFFSVKDTGIGLSPDEMQRLFKSFSQANYSTAKVYGGTGLGLSICKQLVSLFDGDLGVHSEKGKGSTFWFSLPLPKASAEEIADYQTKAAQQLKESNTESNLSTKIILIVDDDDVNRRVLGKMVEKSQGKCLFADSGKKALEILKSDNQVDLVFLDCHMPEMDGYETARQVVVELGNNSPPLIAFTADAFAENKQKCLDAGMVDVVTKPIDLAMIHKTIHKWVA